MFEENIKEYLEKHGFGTFAPKAVLFDMDGVLYDSMSHHARAWHESMRHYGRAMTEEEAYEHEGMRGVETIQKLGCGRTDARHSGRRSAHRHRYGQWPTYVARPPGTGVPGPHLQGAHRHGLRRDTGQTRSHALPQGFGEMWCAALGSHCGGECPPWRACRQCRTDLHRGSEHWPAARPPFAMAFATIPVSEGDLSSHFNHQSK